MLSDPNERTWYDHHKSQILSGKESNEDEDHETDNFGFNVWGFFSSSCYKGFTDEADGFYTVYRGLFEKIKFEEEKAKEMARDEVDEEEEVHVWTGKAPGFGDSKTGWDRVVEFYDYWENNFVSCKTFGWADKYNPNEAENRYVKRLIDKENKKERNRAKKHYMDTIKQLVEFAKKRDPRYKDYLAHKKELEEKKVEAKKRAEDERKKQIAEERRIQREEEMKRWDEEAKERAENLEAQEEAEGEPVHFEDHFCEVCEKEFKTANQLMNHNQSKAHQKKMKELLAEVALSKEKEIIEAEEDAALAKAQDKSKKKKKKKKGKKGEDSDGEAPEDTKATKKDEPAQAPPSVVAKQPEPEPVKAKEDSDEDDSMNLNALLKFKKNAGAGKAKPAAAAKKEEETKEEPVPKATPEKPVDKPAEVKQAEAAPVEKQADDGAKATGDNESSDEEKDDEKGDASGGKKLNKAKLRKMKKKARDEAQKLLCATCKESFETRNKLFDHLKTTNHQGAKG